MVDFVFYILLVYEGIFVVCGFDVVKFFQGQLICNFVYFNDEIFSFGGCCNIKGCLLLSFCILFEGDGLLLVMVGELFEVQLVDLKKYVVFFKVSFIDESVVWFCIGLCDVSEVLCVLGIDILVESGRIVCYGDLFVVVLGDGCVELWVLVQCVEVVFVMFCEYSCEVLFDDWLFGQVCVGIGQVFGVICELFILQMINLQVVGGVSFKKGCYIGQEIVVCMQYFGCFKCCLYCLVLDVDEVLVFGIGLFLLVYFISVGEVVLVVCMLENSVELFVVLQDDVVVDGWISFGSVEGVLFVFFNLFYMLDSDCEIQC